MSQTTPVHMDLEEEADRLVAQAERWVEEHAPDDFKSLLVDALITYDPAKAGARTACLRVAATASVRELALPTGQEPTLSVLDGEIRVLASKLVTYKRRAEVARRKRGSPSSGAERLVEWAELRLENLIRVRQSVADMIQARPGMPHAAAPVTPQIAA